MTGNAAHKQICFVLLLLLLLLTATAGEAPTQIRPIKSLQASFVSLLALVLTQFYF